MNNTNLRTAEIKELEYLQAEIKRLERKAEKRKENKKEHEGSPRTNCFKISRINEEKRRGEFFDYIQHMQESFEIKYAEEKKDYSLKKLSKEFNICREIVINCENKVTRFFDITNYNYPFQKYILTYEDIKFDENYAEFKKGYISETSFSCLNVFNQIIDKYNMEKWDINIRNIFQKDGSYQFYEKDKYILTYLLYVVDREGIGSKDYNPDPITNDIVLDCFVHLLVSNGEEIQRIEEFMYEFIDECLEKFNIETVYNSIKEIKDILNKKDEKYKFIKGEIYELMYDIQGEIRLYKTDCSLVGSMMNLQKNFPKKFEELVDKYNKGKRREDRVLINSLGNKEFIDIFNYIKSNPDLFVEVEENIIYNEADCNW